MVGAKRDAELTKHAHKPRTRGRESTKRNKVLAPVAAAYIEDWLLRISCV